MLCSRCRSTLRPGDKFCGACGTRVAETVTPAQPSLDRAALVREDRGERFALGYRVLIGRLDDCDVSIGERTVSREHARLIRLSNGYIVEDLGSANGTFVNGARISEAVFLQPGDKIRVGSIDLRYEVPNASNP